MFCTSISVQKGGPHISVQKNNKEDDKIMPYKQMSTAATANLVNKLRNKMRVEKPSKSLFVYFRSYMIL